MRPFLESGISDGLPERPFLWLSARGRVRLVALLQEIRARAARDRASDRSCP